MLLWGIRQSKRECVSVKRERTGTVIRLFSMWLEDCSRLARCSSLDAAALMQQRSAVVLKSTAGPGKTIGEIYAGLDSRDYTEPERAPAVSA